MNIFEITIQRQWQPDSWPVVVKRTSSGNLPPEHPTGTFHFSKDDFLQLTKLRHQPKKYGTLLGKALFQEDIRDAFIEAINSRTDNSQVRVLFSVEAKDLKFLHWHWLCFPSKWDFIALNQRILFSFYIPSNPNRRFPPIGRKDLRALIFVANPEDLSSYNLHAFDATETVESIQNALGDIPSDVLALTPGAIGTPTLDQLCDRLTQTSYSLLHIVSHGQVKQGETVLYWARNENLVGPVRTSNLIQRLQNIQNLPHFIFLSACETAKSEAGMALGGLAQRIVWELGILAVLAMTEKVTIETAALLSKAFYPRLRKHGEVDKALVEATSSLSRHDILVPALFSRLGGIPLFSNINNKPCRDNVPFEVPNLLDYSYVKRPESEELKQKVLTKTEHLGVTGIYGMGGIGKSSLAAAIASDQEVKDYFDDGILWKTLGKQPDILSDLKGWVKELGDDKFQAMEIEATSKHLQGLLQDKKVLIVLDDFWNVEHIKYLKIGGVNCHIIVTTRNQIILDQFSAKSYELNVMKLEQALELLKNILERDLDDSEFQLAEELAKTVGYLPLALELSATLVKNKNKTWDKLVEDLNKEVARLKSFNLPGATDDQNKDSLKKLSLQASLNLSIQQLNEQDRNYFILLGVLPDDVSITQKMTATLWDIEEEEMLLMCCKI